MSQSAAKNITDLQYGGLYLPLFALVYLFNNAAVPYQITIWSVELQINALAYQMLIGIAFLGAIIRHQIYRSIYGPEGPLYNPKKPWTVFWQKYSQILVRDPGLRPKSLDELLSRLDSRLSNYVGAVSEARSASFFQQVHTYWRFAKGICRSVVIATVWIPYTLIAYGTLLLLYLEFSVSGLDYIGAVLLVAQAVFFTSGVVANWFPSVVSTQAAPWVYVPEYRKAEILKEREKMELEYDPSGLLQRAADDFAREYQRIHIAPSEEEDVEWLIPLDNSPNYLVSLDDDSSDQ